MPLVHQSTTSAVGAKTLNRSKKVHTEKKKKNKKENCMFNHSWEAVHQSY